MLLCSYCPSDIGVCSRLAFTVCKYLTLGKYNSNFIRGEIILVVFAFSFPGEYHGRQSASLQAQAVLCELRVW